MGRGGRSRRGDGAIDLELADRRVLVAGSSRGIGLAIAQTFLAEGARVAITGRDRPRLAGAVRHSRAAGRRVTSFSGDLTKTRVAERCCATVANRFGGLDVLVSNLGLGKLPRGWDVPDGVWAIALQQNLLGSMRLVRAAVPFLKASNNGSIVLIASAAGLEDIGAPLAYSTAKAALVAAGKGLSRQLAPYGIRVNVVAPGHVIFSGGRWEEIRRERPAATRRMIRASVPLRRFGRPEDIAAAVAFLCSGPASFITGACLVADGGLTHGI